MKIIKWVSLALFLAPAYGAVIGPLNISGSVQVSTTIIDWTSPFVIGGSVGGTFTGTAGTTGNALDLNVLVNPPPQANFLTFNAPALALVHFDLQNFVLGSALPCTGFEVLNQSCTLPGAVFTATVTQDGTTIGMQMLGFFNDTAATFGAPGSTVYRGNYTTQIGSSVAQILATLGGGPGIPGGASPPVPNGFISTTYSASFTQVTGIPEPATYGMIGAGLVSIWAFARRRKTS